MAWLLVFWGSLLLYLGGEVLVLSATRLALALRWSPLLVGLTVVAFGTSAPELAATLIAALKGKGAAAFGNIVGSNIANVSLVLGAAAVITPLRPTPRFLRQELPFMVLTGAILCLLGIDGYLGRGEAVFLLLLLVAFLVALFKRDAHPGAIPMTKTTKRSGNRLFLYLAGLVLGVGLLSLGADALVDGAVRLAQRFGLSERVIGLTLMALGTSFPELASTLVGAYRGAGQIILGNLIGSNIMNVLAVLGLTALIRPLSFPQKKVLLDLSLMMGFSFLAWGMLVWGEGLNRKKGLLALGLYALYILFLFCSR